MPESVELDVDVDPLFLETLAVSDERQSESIRDSVYDMTYTRSAQGPSEIEFKVYDMGLEMESNGFFVPYRDVSFNGRLFQVASAKVLWASVPIVSVTAHTRGIMLLRREKGQRDFGTISPTEFAAQAASRVGLGFFGKSSPASGPIMRAQTETQDESTWDVLSRLANDLDYNLFESDNVLFFAPQDFILEHQPVREIAIPTPEDADIYPLSPSWARDVGTKRSASFSFEVRRTFTSVTLFPGVGLRFPGMRNFPDTFMVESVTIPMGYSRPILVSGSSVDEVSEPTATSTSTGTATSTGGLSLSFSQDEVDAARAVEAARRIRTTGEHDLDRLSNATIQAIFGAPAPTLPSFTPSGDAFAAAVRRIRISQSPRLGIDVPHSGFVETSPSGSSGASLRAQQVAQAYGELTDEEIRIIFGRAG